MTDTPVVRDWAAALADAGLRHPRRILLWFIGLHAALWTFLGHVMRPNFPVDVIEMLVWGREWQWGYFKHPPLPAWVMEGADWVTGGANWAPYLVSQAFVAAMFWAVWRLGAEIVGPRRALLGVVTLAGVGAYDYGALQFNHNVAQYPFWALIGWSLYKAMREDSTRHWLLLGAWTALGLLAKYQTLALLLPLAAFVVLQPQARRCLRTPGPYLAAAVAFVLLLPNLLWLLHHDALGPARFALARTHDGHGAWGYVLYPLDFAINMLFWCGLSLVCLAMLRGRANEVPASRQPDSFDRAYVVALGLGPFALTVGLSAVTGLGAREDWGTPMLAFVGLLGVVFMPAIDGRSLRRFWIAAIATSATVVLLVVAVQQVIDPYRGFPGSYFYPGAKFAREVTAGWRAATNGATLRYVVGDSFTGGNIAYYASDRPSIYLDGDASKSPWIDENDLRKSGAVIVWSTRQDRESPPPANITARFPALVLQKPIVQPAAWPRTRANALGWAIVPPRPN